LVPAAPRAAAPTLAALRPYIERGVPVVGLEPSCILGLRDEYLNLALGDIAGEVALDSHLIEEFLVRERKTGRLQLKLAGRGPKKALLHGHCHQKAFGALGAVEQVLKWIPELEVETVQTSCCGMAGSFGYEAAHYDASMKMAELSLLPKVRAAATDTLLVADGTSCRNQIADGAGREAVHVVRVLREALS
jgi:Fe-S oxidoreductase